MVLKQTLPKCIFSLMGNFIRECIFCNSCHGSLPSHAIVETINFSHYRNLVSYNFLLFILRFCEHPEYYFYLLVSCGKIFVSNAYSQYNMTKPHTSRTFILKKNIVSYEILLTQIQKR